jgi:parallel beta-helix repeat protein
MPGSGVFTVSGAVGDGVTDDTAAVQAALDAARDAGGGIVVIPAGAVYAISTFLAVYDHTVIVAHGATIKAIGNSGLLRNFAADESFSGYDGHSHITVLGGIWDGNAADGTTGAVTAETDVMNFVHCRDITVQGATLCNVSSAHALEFNSCDGGRAIGCRFEGFRDNTGGSRQYSEAVQIDIARSGSSSIGAFDNTASGNILVQGCYCGPSNRLGVFGRFVGSHTIAAGTYYDDIRILDNTVDGTLQEGVRGYGWRRATIRGNTITGTGLSAIACTVPDPATAGYALPCDAIHVDDNIIDTPGDDSSIRVLSYAGAEMTGVRISGNTIDGGGSGSANGVHVEYCTAPAVTGNTVRETASTGVFATHCTDPQISDNTLLDTGSNGINFTSCTGGQAAGNTVSGTGTNYGIYAGQSTGLTVCGNRIAAADVAGVRLSTSATGATVTNNKIRSGGVSVNGISLASTAVGAVIAGNDLSGSGWSVAAALSLSTAVPALSWTGSTTAPGHNIVS